MEIERSAPGVQTCMIKEVSMGTIAVGLESRSSAGMTANIAAGTAVIEKWRVVSADYIEAG